MLLLLFLRLYHEANSGRTVKKSTDFSVAITCIRCFECLDCSSVRVRVFSPFYFRSRIGIVSLPARRRPQGIVIIGVCLSVCLSVCAHCFCPQDISRTGSWITAKFGGWEQGVNL